eukprot:scaffold112705_cov62-Attheya_sp.AAC.4
MHPKEENETKILLFAQAFHKPFMRLSATDNDELTSDFITPNDLLQKVLNEKQPLLARFLYTLMTGELEYNITEDAHTYSVSRIFASQAAYDIVMRGWKPHIVGRTTRLFDFLMDFGGTTNTRRTLSGFRVTRGKKSSHYGMTSSTL